MSKRTWLAKLLAICGDDVALLASAADECGERILACELAGMVEQLERARRRLGA